MQPLDYIRQFPIPLAQLPPRLRNLLEPIGDDPQLRVEVALRYDVDKHGPDREYVQMITALVPESDLDNLRVPRETRDGVVYYSTPDVREKGGLAQFSPSISGLDYIVASWGDGSYYSYSLAEKVWIALGLSSRCLGGDAQRIIYDDLSLPEFGVAEGEISTEYYWSPKRNVCWTMSNEYLRRYLWMRGCHGVRIFFYEALVPDSREIREVMAGKSHILLKPDDGWYELDIREFQGSLLIQIWASVAVISPELCPELSAEGLQWPDVESPMTHDRANALVDITPVYLDDRFLERYEQSSFFDTTPVKVYGQWNCSPSYRGQWGFTDCKRVGRNLIKVSMRELYKPKPDRDILHAYAHVLATAQAASFDQNEEHIVSKVERLLDQLLDLGDHLHTLGAVVGVQRTAAEIVKFSRAELRANGWLSYPELSHLAQVVPIAIAEQNFLSRCKSIHELWQRIPNGFLRALVENAGHARSDIKDLGSLKLLQALSNIVERLNTEDERIDAFSAGAELSDLQNRNAALAALFVVNNLRIADAHEAGDVLISLESLDFDTAGLNQGFGLALDHVLDGTIAAFFHLNTELDKLLNRK